MALRVDSEIGRLRRVLVHRPGREIDWMVPSMMSLLLFDDILDGEQARKEHDAFSRVLAAAGAELLYAEALLAEVLGQGGPRAELMAELTEEYGVGADLARILGDLTPEELAMSLIAGVRASTDLGRGRRDFFGLSPVSNYFFQRDPQAVIGDRVVVSSMATDSREREPLLARFLFQYHPQLAGSAGLYEIDRPPQDAPEYDPSFPYPTLEGGDVVVASPEILLVGISARTNRRGVELLAEHLRVQKTPFRHLVAVELPAQRSYMHLDTVFTLIDQDACLAYLPVIEPGGPHSAHVSRVDLEAPELRFSVRPSLLETLRELGLELETVPCGGAEDPIVQQREQWTDGANAFAVAPGVICLYRRNRRTIAELARRGWRVVDSQDVAEGRVPLLGEGKTVVSIRDNELSRARGGPRCMTMPLQREGVG